MPKSEKVRINFDLSAALKQRVDELQDQTHSGSITEVFRRALALLDLVTKHSQGGGDLILRDKEGKEQILRLL